MELSLTDIVEINDAGRSWEAYAMRVATVGYVGVQL